MTTSLEQVDDMEANASKDKIRIVVRVNGSDRSYVDVELPSDRTKYLARAVASVAKALESVSLETDDG